MQIGMCGLGRMGANMARRLIRGGHAVVVHDRSRGPVEELVREGATGAFTPQEFARPRSVRVGTAVNVMTSS